MFIHQYVSYTPLINLALLDLRVYPESQFTGNIFSVKEMAPHHGAERR